VITLKESNFQSNEFWFPTWAANAELGTTKEDLLKPAFWAHVAPKLRPGAIVLVRAEDNSFFAQLFVVDSGRTWAKMHILLFVEMDAVASPEIPSGDGEFTVKWAGPQAKFRVTRVSDKAVMKDGFPNKNEADKWIIDYQKALSK
jgi:hypothetical protein